MDDTNEMTSIEIKFRCDECKREQLVEARVSTKIHLSADCVPDGWVVRPENENTLRCYCPEHAGKH